ncbi:glycosyltransferase [uncultured Sphingomonas sp.]|uniref:glycosyltransferase n=1 Tax=uncultured Sphingomonas sp. TaxID=158754 RepID=UPI0035C9D4D1
MWLSTFPTEPGLPPRRAHRVAVAIPARDEALHIAACISALDEAAAQVTASEVSVLVLVNNSSDDTAAIARGLTPVNLRLAVQVADFSADVAHAGSARKLALDRCAAALPPEAILMTTDADSWVDAGWIAANLVAIEAGADAVAGAVTFDAATRAALPDLSGRALEWRLAHLHARLGTLVDPRAHDRWPNHIWAWGASLALTVAAYRQVGGVPAVAYTEDRLLAEAIEWHDLRLRRSHAPVVYTSARQHGRANGGFAAMIGSYASDPHAACDSALEPTAALLHRLRWRARLRRAFAEGGPPTVERLFPELGFEATGSAATFGAWWRLAEQRAPSLARRPVTPAMLEAEVRRAERLVSRLERCEARRGGSPLAGHAR